MSELDHFSAAFHSTAGPYFLSHSVGLQPKNTLASIDKDFLNVWAEQGEAWDKWLTRIDDFKLLLASLFNAKAGEFCPQVNLSDALTKIIGALPRHDGKNKIVYTENDFPSMAFVLMQMQELGYELVCIAEDEDVFDLDIWGKHLADDVACVFLTHVQSNTGIQAPISSITEIASTRNIYSIIDIAQSAGVIPINLQDWSADFVIGSCVKWLCGGPGAGFLWVREAIIEDCQPKNVGWFSHANPFEFDIHHFQYASDASRFWGGTPSVLPYVVASNSIQLLLDAGIDTIFQHNRSLTEKIMLELDDNAIINPVESEQRGGTLILNFDDRQESVIERLKQNNIRFDARSYGLRLSPHLYNTEQDVSNLLEVLLS